MTFHPPTCQGLSYITSWHSLLTEYISSPNFVLYSFPDEGILTAESMDKGLRKLFSVNNSRRASITSISTTPTTAKTDYSNHLTHLSSIFYISADRDKTMETTTTATAEMTASPERTELVTQTPTTRVRPRDQDSTPSGFSPPSRMTRMVSPGPESAGVGSGVNVRAQFTLNPTPNLNP